MCTGVVQKKKRTEEEWHVAKEQIITHKKPNTLEKKKGNGPSNKSSTEKGHQGESQDEASWADEDKGEARKGKNSDKPKSDSKTTKKKKRKKKKADALGNEVANVGTKLNLGGEITMKRIIAGKQSTRDFDACCRTVNAAHNKKLFDSQMTKWWNKHSHVVIDAKGQNENRHFLHLEELTHRGHSQTVFHKQETVKEMMNQRSDEKTAATAGAVGKPPIVLLVWRMKRKKGVHETLSLEVLEMPCGEHDDVSIANLLSNFPRKQV